ncbi:MAG: holo-ACP synthase [Verrucomicrobiota bacterium]|nr:holo-ACP synthase [Verrucomicrobiota bacterium]
MIVGLGIDLVEVERIRKSIEKFPERFASRLLSADERAYCFSHKDPAIHMAARFAAKEAVSKAFGTGIGSELGWQDIEVAKELSGQPLIRLRGKAEKLAQQRLVRRIHLSLTHTSTHAAAVAVLESD